MITLPMSPEIEKLIEQLPESEKKKLSLLIQVFVTRPKRTMSQVMDDIADYAKKRLDKEKTTCFRKLWLAAKQMP